MHVSRARSGSALVIAVLAAAPAASAAPFANLDFEQVDFTGDPAQEPGLLAGWAMYSAAWAIYPSFLFPAPARIYLNLACLGSPCAFLHDSGIFPGLESVPLEGRYSVFLQSGTGAPSSPALVQSGEVPPGTRSLRLLAREGAFWQDPVDWLEVEMGGSILPLVQLEALGDDVRLLGADVSALAGTSAELRLRVLRPTLDDPMFYESNIWVDALEFSPLPVPEPRTAMLLVAGLVALGARRAQRRGSAR